MAKRLYTDEDGSAKTDVRDAAMKVEARAGVDAAEVDNLIGELEVNGYVIIPELFSREWMQDLKQEIGGFLQHDGRNEFEGFKTRRIYSVIEKTLACNPLVEHPLILSLLDRLLMPKYLLSQLQAINVYPGEVTQPLHHDDGFYPLPRPRPALSAATIWAVDDFTADNGATLVLPKSHLWGDRDISSIDQSEMVPAVMPAGSVVFFSGTLWHCAGPNNSDQSRMAVTAQYCEPWARQQENYSLAISRERARLCSDTIKGMLGYSMLFPFIGFVNGRDPMRLLK